MATLEEINELLEIEDILASAKPEKATWGDVAKSFVPVAATSAGAGIGGAVQSIEEMNPASIAAMPYHAAGMLATPLKYIGMPEASESFREAGRAIEGSFPEGTKNISIAGLEKALGRDKTLGEEAYQHWNQETADAMPEVKPGSAKSNVLGILQNVTINAPMMAAAALTKKPMVGLAPMGVVSGGLQYGEIREKRPDLSSGEALAGGLVSGATEILTEKIPLEQMIKPGYSFGKRVFLTSLADVPGEEVATTIQDGIVAKATTNPDMTWGDFVQSLKDTAIQSAGASLVQGSAAHGIVSWANRQQEKIAEEKKAAPTQPPPSEPPPGTPPGGQPGGPTFNGFEDFAGAYQDGATYDDLKGKRDEYSKRPDADPNVLSDVDTFLGEVKPPVDGKIEELKSIHEANGITDDELITQAGKLIAEYPNEKDKIKSAFPNVPVTLTDALKKSESVTPFTDESDALNKSIIENIAGLKENDKQIEKVTDNKETKTYSTGSELATALYRNGEVDLESIPTNILRAAGFALSSTSMKMPENDSRAGQVYSAIERVDAEIKKRESIDITPEATNIDQPAPLPKPPEDSISGKVEGPLTAKQAVQQYKDAQIAEANKTNRAGSWDLSAIGNYADGILKKYLDAIEKHPFKPESYFKAFLFKNSKDDIVGNARANARKAGLLDVAYDKQGNPFYALKGTTIPEGIYSEAHVTELDKKYNGWENIPTDAWDKPVSGKVEAAGKVKEPWDIDTFEKPLSERGDRFVIQDGMVLDKHYHTSITPPAMSEADHLRILNELNASDFNRKDKSPVFIGSDPKTGKNIIATKSKEDIIKEALANGEKVHESHLKDYPDLQKPAPKPEGEVKQEADGYINKEIIPYSKDLKIKNIDALPRGVGARYLLAIKDDNGGLIAKQWRRTIPHPMNKIEVLIDFKPETAENKPAQEQKAAEPTRDINNTATLDAKHTLRKPIKGKTGSEIIGYEWVSELQEGMYGDRRVSDWANAQTSEPTGRQIVHLFWVRDKEGNIQIMGVNAAKNALGIDTNKLYSIAKVELANQKLMAEYYNELDAELLKTSPETAIEAAREWRKRNNGLMEPDFAKRQRIIDDAFKKTSVITKNGKFVRTGDKELVANLKDRGWAEVPLDSEGVPVAPTKPEAIDYSKLSDDELTTESKRLSDQAARENAGSGGFFRNEKSKATYNEFLKAERELGKRQSAKVGEQAEVKRKQDDISKVNAVINRRPETPTLKDVDAMSNEGIAENETLVSYQDGHRVVDRQYKDRRGEVKHSYELQIFDVSDWKWEPSKTKQGQTYPKKEFKRLLQEEPLTQNDVDFWTKELTDKIGKIKQESPDAKITQRQAEAPATKIIPTTKTAEKNVTTPKEQKAYVLDKLDDLVIKARQHWRKSTEAPDAMPDAEIDERVSKGVFSKVEPPEGAATVIIEVPNDGQYKVPNTLDSLLLFKKKFKAMSINTAPPDIKPPMPSKKPTGKPISDIQKEAWEDYRNLYRDYKEDGRTQEAAEMKQAMKEEYPELYKEVEKQEAAENEGLVEQHKFYSDTTKEQAEADKWHKIVADMNNKKITLKSLSNEFSGKTPSSKDVHQKSNSVYDQLNSKIKYAESTKEKIKTRYPELYNEMFGETKFQRGPKSTGLQQSQVQSVIDKAVSSIPNAPKVNVVQGNKDCPAEVQRIMEAEGIDDAMGFTHNGEVYLVADNLRNQEEALRTLAHELTHSGLGKFFQRQTKGKLMPVRVKYEALMDSIYRAHSKEIEQLAKTTHTHLDTRTVQGRRQACEEWLCNQTYEAQPKWYDKLVAIFHDLLRAIGLDVKLSDAEVRVVLQDAFKEFGEGQIGVHRGQPMFSRSKDSMKKWWEGMDIQKQLESLPLKFWQKPRNFIAMGYVPITRAEADQLYYDGLDIFVAHVNIKGELDTTGNEGIFMRPLSFYGYEYEKYNGAIGREAEAARRYREYRQRYNDSQRAIPDGNRNTKAPVGRDSALQEESPLQKVAENGGEQYERDRTARENGTSGIADDSRGERDNGISYPGGLQPGRLSDESVRGLGTEVERPKGESVVSTPDLTKFQRQEKEAVDEASEPTPPEYDLGDLESKRKELDDYRNRLRRSLEFPETVMLARDLLGGKFPIIMAKLRSAFGNSALGKFIPQGEGNILLKAGIFSDIDTASKVLAHEIGHLVDYLPNHLMTRGNILGRIASLNRYMKNYLEEFKGAPGLLTDEDRKRLQKEAREQVKSEEKPDEVIVEEIIKEIPQYEYTGITPEIILDLMKGRIEGKVAPELYEYLQRAETKEKKRIVLQAMKQMVDERVAQFGSKKQVGTETVRETVERVIPGVKYDAETIYKRFKELLNAEINKRVLYRKEVISAELKKLTKLWSPFDDSIDSSYRKYRWSSKELYADAFSVFINYPSLMQQETPTFHKAFLSWIEAKPEVKETYDAYQKLATDREAVQERREKYIYEMQKGHKTKEQEVMEQIEAERKISPRNILRELYKGLIDRNLALMDAVKKLKKAGKTTAANTLEYFKEERNYLASEADFYLEEVKQKIIDPLEKAGFNEDDLGYLGMLMRTATQRRDVANPGGMGGYFSDEQIEHLKNKLGTERFNTLKGLLEKFSELRQELVIPKLEEAGMYSEALLNTMKTEKNYLTFNVTKFLDKMYGGIAQSALGKVYHTLGTFQEIQNPFVATIFKDISLMRAAEITKYKKELHKTFSENEELQDQIQPAEQKFNGTAQVFVEPKDPKMGMISYLKNGKVEAFYITKEIADDFNSKPVEAMHVLKFFNALMMPVKALLVNRNPIWMFRNVVRDYLGTAQNIPGAKVTNLLPYYRKAFVDAWGEVMQGKKLDVVQTMKKGKMLVIDRQYHLSDDMSDDSEFDKLYAKFGHHGEKQRQIVIEKILQAWDFLGDLGKVSERAGKIAGYRWMKENTNMTEREIGHVVRSRIGTPDVYRRGAWQLVTNNLFLYSNVGKEGFRSSWESFQDNKAAYTWKLVKYNIMPKAVLALAALGAFGDDAEDIIKRISNYDKANYLVVPFNKTADGRAVYLRMPQSYTGQVLGAIMWDILNLEFKKATESVASMQPYSFNPVIKAVLNWGLYAMDTNPQDWYRGQNIVNRKEWDAGEPYRLIEMSKHTWNSVGGGLLYKFNKGQDPKGVWEQISSLPGLNIMGSFLKESKQGLNEEYYKASQKAKQASALKSINKDEEVAKRERNKRKLSEAKSLLRKGFINYDTYKETVARYQ